jgi:transposase
MSKKVQIVRVEAPASISAQQEQAIGLMVAGTSATDAAARVGVSRATLYRWQREAPQFIAAWNGWRRDVSQSARSRLLNLAEDAVKAVQGAIQQGDAKLAFQLLKHMNLFAQEPQGSDDPEVIRRETKLAQREKAQELARQELGLDLDPMQSMEGER